MVPRSTGRRGVKPADPPGAAGRGHLAPGRSARRAGATGPPHDLPQRPRIPTVRRRRRLDRRRPHASRLRARPRRAARNCRHRGPAEVPTAKRDRFVATFNGGFPLETSNAGLVYRGQTIATMVERDRHIGRVPRRADRHRALGARRQAPARAFGSRSRTCRRSSSKASSTRISATVPNGEKRSTTRCGSGARGSGSTAAAT